VSLLPKEVHQSLLKHVLRYTPQLPLVRSLLKRCPEIDHQMGTPRLQLSLLHSFCNSAQPTAATLRWLLAERLQFAPRDIRNGDEPHPLSSMVRQGECVLGCIQDRLPLPVCSGLRAWR
jgi:hypothetical protein